MIGELFDTRVTKMFYELASVGVFQIFHLDMPTIASCGVCACVITAYKNNSSFWKINVCKCISCIIYSLYLHTVCIFIMKMWR